MSGWKDKLLFGGLVLLLIILEFAHIRRSLWDGDFWEHAAVVNELSRHPFDPGHPILDLDAPHIFFSPYSLCVALVSRAVHISPVSALTIFAFINLLLLLYGFWFFCKALFGSGYLKIAALGLIFILLFWGRTPSLWSGFYHIFVLHSVLPYPSTFAMGASLLSLGLLAEADARWNVRKMLVIPLSALVFISHPYTGIFLAISVFCMVFTFHKGSLKHRLLDLVLLLAPVLLLCCFWPYYSFIDFVNGDNSDFHIISKPLYRRVAGIYWPMLLIPVSAYFAERSAARKFLLAAIVSMLLLFAAGYVSGAYGYSRIISGAMLFSQLFIAFAMIRPDREKRVNHIKLFRAACVVLFVVACIRNSDWIRDTLLPPTNSDISYYSRFDFLRTYIQEDDLVLSDELSNWYIPGFNGKVIASVHPLFSVADSRERKEDIRKFFAKGTSSVVRDSLVRKYHPVYALINEKSPGVDKEAMHWLESLGSVVYNKGELRLIRIDYHRSGN